MSSYLSKSKKIYLKKKRKEVGKKKRLRGQGRFVYVEHNKYSINIV